MDHRIGRLRASAAAVCATALCVSCGGEFPEESATTQTADELTTSQTDIEARVYDGALTNYVATLEQRGTTSAWKWFVASPEVSVTTAGARLTGTLFAQERFPTKFKPALLHSQPFDFPVSFSYASGRLKMAVGSGTVRVMGSQGLTTLVSVSPSTLYSASFPLSQLIMPVGGHDVTLNANEVHTTTYSGYVRVRVAFNLQ